MDEKDNLKKFGGEFQYKCITALLTDKLFFEQIFDILSPDYFESDANKWIVNQITSYYLEYKCTPTMNVFKVMLDKLDDNRDGILKSTVKEQLKNIYTHINDTDITFVKTQFYTFILFN